MIRIKSFSTSIVLTPVDWQPQIHYSAPLLTFGVDCSPGSDVQVQGGAEGEGPELRHRGGEQQRQQQVQTGWG